MRVSFLASGILEALKPLYENEIDIESLKSERSKALAGKRERPNLKMSKKRKTRTDYLWEEECEDEDSVPELTSYDKAYSPKTGSADYVQKSSNASNAMREASGKAQTASYAGLRKPEATAKDHVEKSTTTSEAGKAMTELKSMIASAGVNDAKYLTELGEATSLDTGSLRAAYKASMVKVEYSDPVFMNNQRTYQRIFMKNDKNDSSVYDFTMGRAGSAGLETKVRRDERFDTFYFESMNGVRDGQNKAYWEVWVNGNIVEEALDKKEVKKGDVVEWRLANERESFCGGGGMDERLQRPEYRSRPGISANPGALQPYSPAQGVLGSYGNLNPLLPGISHAAIPGYTGI
jgi:hypothetical protein